LHGAQRAFAGWFADQPQVPILKSMSRSLWGVGVVQGGYRGLVRLLPVLSAVTPFFAWRKRNPEPTSNRKEWEVREEAARRETGKIAATEMEHIASDKLSAILDRIIDMPATTIAGLCFKAMVVDKTDGDDVVASSLVGDLLAMRALPVASAAAVQS
jgi:hypothetical protein